MGVQVESEMNIWTAASDGNIELVKEWLEKIPVDSQDEQGYSCLHAAASYGHLDLLQLLVEKYKADLQLKDIEGDTALHLVEDLVTCKMLIELGADPTLRNNDGILPIEICHKEGYADIVEYLKDYTPEYRELDDSDDNNEEQLAQVMDLLHEQGVDISFHRASETDDNNV